MQASTRPYYIFDEDRVNEQACREQGDRLLRSLEVNQVVIHFHLYGLECTERCYTRTREDLK
jgi:hypothetical protein